MKSHGQQREVAATHISEINHRFKNLNGAARSLVPEPRSKRLVEALASSAVIEERNRLAREIHDTLVQEFAGILLHLEAVNGSDEPLNLSECFARVRELAKCGLEDARRMLLGLRPKSLEGANLSDALGRLAGRFSRDCGIHCTFNVSGRSHKLTEERQRIVRRAGSLMYVVKAFALVVSRSCWITGQAVTMAIKDNGRVNETA
jgi:signal transduction histidine kinase